MLKQALKFIITGILRLEAKIVVFKYKPKIIGVTGTVGKTSAKDMIFTLMSRNSLKTRRSEKSYNSELGVPLTILGAKSAWTSVYGWVEVVLEGLRLIIAKNDYPEWLVLEMGIDRPKDMEKLISWIKPKIGVITALGEVPVHVEFFDGPEKLTEEKSKLVQVIDCEGYAILPADDNKVSVLKKRTCAKVLTFGFSESDVRASGYHLIYNNDGVPEGTGFKMECSGNIVPVKIPGALGKQAVRSALAAMAVGTALGLNMVKMAEAFSKYIPPKGRLNAVGGIKKSLILDDTYNSSPLALQAALELLLEIPAKRKIAILGDMLELGKHTATEHRKIGATIKKYADILVAVGPRARLIADQAKMSRFGVRNIFEFTSSKEAKKEIGNLIEEEDLILIKGSQGVRMEKIVESIMAEPNRAAELLVRQEKEWKEKV